MLYRFCRLLLRVLFKVVYRFEARGVSHIPLDGPVVLSSNHKSLIDPMTLGIAVPRKVHYMAKQELFGIPLFGPFIRALGAFPVKRGGVSKEAIRTALSILEEGKVMGIFPEGTRKGERIDGVAMGKRGAISMAARSGAAVVPVALVGDYRPFRKMMAVYGAPLDLSPYLVKGAEDYEAATELMMSRIREMIRTGRPAE
ncbi:1-acyl-sn-glycerol-3-phosphate acyltransferase [Cohnella xylanilytica]|uniref:1-acyl-sn-glycerol-3-phosphate acyltransferase n=1 Tax=Cohnella xylanilytica TaxID=557555 RepID=A0A841TWY1_9BACL|nr:lysophospholipid acyltransferase family protein [Cohnella xylanilytica]MBB6690144.1 1-acyl-sn-glycerol-3-phosphate acyltransferase [Cohnella xylanilytica]GIO11710.1 1-acyl-sn-glycerol-3-phosphate acyltransferase [Cohnella xylanilytica]